MKWKMFLLEATLLLWHPSVASLQVLKHTPFERAVSFCVKTKSLRHLYLRLPLNMARCHITVKFMIEIFSFFPCSVFVSGESLSAGRVQTAISLL